MNLMNHGIADAPSIDEPAMQPEPAEIGWSEFREENPDRAEQIDLDWVTDNLEAMDALVDAEVIICQQHDRPGVLNRSQLAAIARIRAAVTSLLKFRDNEMQRVTLRRRQTNRAIDSFQAALRKPEIPSAPATTTERIIQHNMKAVDMMNEAMGLPPLYDDALGQ